MYIPLLVVSFPTTFSTFSNIPHVQSSVLPSIRFDDDEGLLMMKMKVFISSQDKKYISYVTIFE